MKSVAYLLKFYVTTVIIFVVAKLAFILSNAPSTPFSDIVQVVCHGLSLDLSTALYFLIVPYLFYILHLLCILPSRYFHYLLTSYYVLLSLAFSLAFVVDTSLYAFWGFKLDASCLQYLSQPEGITASVSFLYIFVRFLLIIIIAVAIFALYSLPPSRPAFHAAIDGNNPGRQWFRRFAVAVLYLAFTPLLVIGMRGGLSESTTNIGQVYFSERQFLNHAAVNPVFNFISSLSHQVGDLSQFQFMSDDEARHLTTEVYTTESSVDSTSLLTTATPSIVVIIMESAGEQFASVMPRLQQLKQEGVCFSECYANSWRTDRGTLSLLSGYPSFPTLSVMKMPNVSRTLPSIAAILRQRGYATHYLYGGDINFTNMRSYLLSTGWQGVTSMDDYTAEERATAKWGVRDDITFKTLRNLLTSRSSSRTSFPCLIGYSTLSSHEPWDVPLHRHDDPVLNAFAYLDDCLGNFIDSLRATPQWNNLLVVITADHGIVHDDIDAATPRRKNHIPMLWVGGAVREPRVINTLCNQNDLAATLLAQLGLPHQDFTFSRDVLSATYTHPTAVHNYSNAQWIIDATGQLTYDLDAQKVTFYSPSTLHPSPSTVKDSLLRLNQAILQLTTADLSER